MISLRGKSTASLDLGQVLLDKKRDIEGSKFLLKQFGYLLIPTLDTFTQARIDYTADLTAHPLRHRRWWASLIEWVAQGSPEKKVDEMEVDLVAAAAQVVADQIAAWQRARVDLPVKDENGGWRKLSLAFIPVGDGRIKMAVSAKGKSGQKLGATMPAARYPLRSQDRVAIAQAALPKIIEAMKAQGQPVDALPTWDRRTDPAQGAVDEVLSESPPFYELAQQKIG